jgi:hypothetical protein
MAKFSGAKTIELVQTLIRYDIPFLLLGKSSIGKSYSMIEMAKRFRIPTNILYIGSEKPSNIEGLPRLTGKVADTSEVLEFYKPNWFPNEKAINQYVSNGKKLFENYAKNFLDEGGNKVLQGKDFPLIHRILKGLFYFEWDSEATTSQKANFVDVGSQMIDMSDISSLPVLNTKPFPVKRDLPEVGTEFDPNKIYADDVRDFSLYLSTLCGYGNFWLMLDELDKVDEREQDKYAPLLHIVRERTIKNFSFRQLNDGEGVGVPKRVINSNDYSAVKKSLDESIEKDLPLLDGRIIGIANATDTIEDALFRRFCHLVVEDIMMVTEPPKALAEMRSCLESVNEKAGINVARQFTQDLKMQFIEDVNLQWQFGFFPKMINTKDRDNNFIYTNLKEDLLPVANKLKNYSAYSEEILSTSRSSGLYKIIRNNFAIADNVNSNASQKFHDAIYQCLLAEIFDVSGGVEVSQANTEGVQVESKADALQNAVMQEVEALRASGKSDEDIARTLSDKIKDQIQELSDSPKGTNPNNVFVTSIFPIAYGYLEHTKFDKSSGEQTELNKMLMPLVVREVYSGILNFSGSQGLNIDFVGKQKILNEFQDKVLKKVYSKYVDAVNFNQDITQEVFDGDFPSNTFYGTSEEYLPSISGSVMRNNKRRLLELVDFRTRSASDSEKFIQEYPNVFRFIQNNYAKEIVESKKEALDKKQNLILQKVGMAYDQLIKMSKVDKLENIPTEKVSEKNAKALEVMLQNTRSLSSNILGFNSLSKSLGINEEYAKNEKVKEMQTDIANIVRKLKTQKES